MHKPSAPLVTPLLHSVCYSLGALGFLNHVDPSVSVFNYYLVLAEIGKDYGTDIFMTKLDIACYTSYLEQVG